MIDMQPTSAVENILTKNLTLGCSFEDFGRWFSDFVYQKRGTKYKTALTQDGDGWIILHSSTRPVVSVRIYIERTNNPNIIKTVFTLISSRGVSRESQTRSFNELVSSAVVRFTRNEEKE